MLSHGQDHVSKGRMVDLVNKYRRTVGFTVLADIFCKKKCFCITDNVGHGIFITPASHPRPEGPFEHLMDFIELTSFEGNKYCLVIVDMLSKSVEVFPCRIATACTVAKTLLREIIPR